MDTQTDTHLEDTLREGMRARTDGIEVAADLADRAAARYGHRRRVTRSLIGGGAMVVIVAVALVLAFVVFPSGQGTQAPVAVSPGQSAAQASLAALVTKFQQPKSAVFDFKLTSAAGQVTSGKEWNQGGQMVKIETTVKGADEVIIVDIPAGTTTVYYPGTNKGTVTKSSIPFPDPVGTIKGLSLSDLKDLGTATMDGKPCRVVGYTITHKGPNGTTITYSGTTWLGERLAFPVKQMITTQNGATTTLEFSNVRLGPLPSDSFTVPANVKIMTA